MNTHRTCATHCLYCGRCMEADEPYTTEFIGPDHYDICDPCAVAHPQQPPTNRSTNMDPTTALAIVQDTSEDNYDRDQAAQALTEWLDAGGFPPSGYSEAQTRHILATFRGRAVAR